jgi:hypothetical protein
MPHDIVYPQGCRPVTDDLGPDELIRRLKVIACLILLIVGSNIVGVRTYV